MAEMQTKVEEVANAGTEGRKEVFTNQTQSDILYLIFATGGARVNFFWMMQIFTDLTRKIGNLLRILP